MARPIRTGTAVLIISLLTILLMQSGAAWATTKAAQDTPQSWPPDTNNYARPAVAEDYSVAGAAVTAPGVFIVDVVVSNTDPNLTNTDTANDGETSIAVNPQDPDEIVIAAFSGAWGANAPIYHTTDGGNTWTRQLSVPVPPGWPAGCPCDWTWDYGRNDELSAAILANSPTVAGGIDVVSGTTTNPAQSASWNYFDPPGPPVQAQETNINYPGSLGNADQPWLLVNRDPTAAAQDNVYVAYDDFNNTDGIDGPDLRVAVSYNQNPPNFTADSQAGNALGAVNPGLRLAKDPRTGTMWALWGRNIAAGDDDSKNMNYMLNRSTDGGATWSLNGSTNGIVVANADSTQPRPKFGTVNALLGGVHHAAVDPQTGDLYYVYGNRDSGTNNDRLAIRRISSDGSGNAVIGSEHFVTGQVEAAIPVVAVTENRVVGVFYYTFDGFSSDDFPIFSAYLALSEDQGVTFDHLHLLTFLSSAQDNSNNRQRVLGDYMQMQHIDNCFYGSFTGNGVPFGRPFANHDPIFFRVCVGAQIQVPNDLDFGDTCRGSTGSETLQVCNVGTENLVVHSITSSDPQFAVTEPSAGFPVNISPDFCFPFEATFTPASGGLQEATLTIVSNDPANSTVTAQAAGTGAEADINVSMVNAGDYGNVCLGDLGDLNLQILNQGACDLEISDIDSSNPTEFVLPDSLAFPLVLSPDSNVDVPIRFEPDTDLACSDSDTRDADITISSDDPNDPTVVQAVSGQVPCPVASTIGELDFGQLCIGDSQTQTVEVCDTGPCNMSVTGAELVGPDCDDLTLVSPNPPPTADDPLVISPDFCFGFVVKYEPDDLTPPNCSLEITTDDPDNPTITFPIDATVGVPVLVLDPPDLYGIYAFPPTVTDPEGDLACYSERTVVIRNVGTCPADITNITAQDSPPFQVVAPTEFPLTLLPGEETLEVTVRFAPTTGGGSVTEPDETTGTLTVYYDPGANQTAGNVCGEAVVQSGGRWLVIDGSDVPFDSVDQMSLMSKGIHQPQPVKISQKKVPLQEFEICGNTIRYHLSREDLPPTETSGSNPNSSYTIRAKEGNRQAQKSFTLGQCEFKVDVIKLK